MHIFAAKSIKYSLLYIHIVIDKMKLKTSQFELPKTDTRIKSYGQKKLTKPEKLKLSKPFFPILNYHYDHFRVRFIESVNHESCPE
jgi:hypothetical protein